MGWCSGTPIFDDMVKLVIDEIGEDIAPSSFAFKVLKRLAVSMEDHDWDCPEDSDYWNGEPVRSVFKELHPQWFDATDHPEVNDAD